MAQHGIAGAASRDVRFAQANGKAKSFFLSWSRGDPLRTPSRQPQCPASSSHLRPLSCLCTWQPSHTLSHTNPLPCLRRTDAKTPKFSCILYALKTTQQVQVRGEVVKFKVSSCSGSTHQYWLLRSPRQDPEATLILAALCR